MRVLTDLPAYYIKIESGLGKAAPSCIVLLPLQTDDGDVVAVMELAFLDQVADTTQRFLRK